MTGEDASLPPSHGPACPCRRLPWHDGRAVEILGSAEALLDGLAGGADARPALRWYVASDEALLLGAAQQAGTIDYEAARTAGVAIIRRAAGGNVVLSDGDTLGLDIVLPPGDPLWSADLTRSYRWIGEAWAEALATLGVDAAVVGIEEARASAHVPGAEADLARRTCFGGLSPHEVTAGGRKLVGLAQVRRRHGALFQCALLLRWSPERLTRLLALPPGDRETLTAALQARATGLDVAAGRIIVPSAIAAAVEAACRARGLVLSDSPWTVRETERAVQLTEERYLPLAPDLPAAGAAGPAS